MLPTALRLLLKQVSRSFYLSVRVLPASVQYPIGLGYLLARAADSIADTPLLPASERLVLLQRLAQAAGGDASAQTALMQGLERARLSSPQPTAPQPPNPTAQAEARLLSTLPQCLSLLSGLPPDDQRLVRWVLDQLTLGMGRDLTRFPCADATVPPDQVVALARQSDLDEYCYFAAGCVGEFWTDLTAAHVPQLATLRQPDLRQRGVALGNALQLVNVVRDVVSDLRIGRCYWPADLLAAHGLSPHRLAELAHGQPPQDSERPALIAATHTLCDQGSRLCQQAWPYVQAIPPSLVRLRLACVWPLLLALDTLAALRSAGSPLLFPTAPVKVSRSHVYSLLWQSSRAAVRDRLFGSAQLDRVFANRLQPPSPVDPAPAL